MGQQINFFQQKLDDLNSRLKSPDRIIDEFKDKIQDCDQRMKRNLQTRFEHSRERVYWLEKSLEGRTPLGAINAHKKEVDRFIFALGQAMDSRLFAWKTRTRELGVKLSAFNPKSVLDRGYSISRILPGKKILMDAGEAAVDDKIEIVLSKGRLVTRVEKH
jgi:exodeoxyribonuclease VII large subunit